MKNGEKKQNYVASVKKNTRQNYIDGKRTKCNVFDKKYASGRLHLNQVILK